MNAWSLLHGSIFMFEIFHDITFFKKKNLLDVLVMAENLRISKDETMLLELYSQDHLF